MIVHTIALLGGFVFPVDASAPPTHPLPTNPCISEQAFIDQMKTSAPVVLPGHPERISLGGKVYVHMNGGWCPP